MVSSDSSPGKLHLRKHSVELLQLIPGSTGNQTMSCCCTPAAQQQQSNLCKSWIIQKASGREWHPRETPALRRGSAHARALCEQYAHTHAARDIAAVETAMMCRRRCRRSAQAHKSYLNSTTPAAQRTAQCAAHNTYNTVPRAPGAQFNSFDKGGSLERSTAQQGRGKARIGLGEGRERSHSAAGREEGQGSLDAR